ncbi:ndh1 [Mytilus coruscus]|uniref:Ndh1 n=1 Tax=Mytilus coruscus TaxID=42192 RepID=A0A6J8DXX8_MYTCO|nr:ndh1 [Mytilus coruscus]
MALRAIRLLVSRGKTNLARINDITNPTSTEKRERLVILGTGVLKSELKYTIDFDKLVIGVGALSNTFNVPGVQEHSFFLKVGFNVPGVSGNIPSFSEVKKDCVILSNGETIPCGMVVWSGGIAPRQFVSDLDLKKNKQGQILTDKYLHVLGDDSKSVFAIGDCADIQDMPLPCTAQVAEREGRYLAKMLNHGKEFTEPFEFQSMGMLAYIGKYQALTDVKQIKMQGFTSWIVWRSAYLTRLGSWRLRMQVPIDWLKTLMYGRDISRFD